MGHRIVWQLAGVLGASIVLGFAFNASSPVGVRFSDASSESPNTTNATTNQPSTATVVAVTNRIAILPPSPPLPVQKPGVRQAAAPAPAPMPIPISAQATTPPAHVAAPVSVQPSPTPTAAIPTTPPIVPNPAPIHWAQAKPLVAAGEAVLVDVRAKVMYDAGHIPGAVSLPETSSPEEFTAFLTQHPTNLALILYCSSVSCSQSARVANRLVTQFQRPSVKFMTGGYLEYQQAELANNPAQPKP